MRRLLGAATLGLILLGCDSMAEDPGESGGSGGSGGGDTSDATSASTSGGAGGEGGGSGVTLGPELCPDDDRPSGVEVGDRLGAFVVRDCSGKEVSLDAFCGASTLWIFAAHAWCPLCRSVSSAQESIVADYADRGLVAINVVSEAADFSPPDSELCATWREVHGQVEVYTLYDPTQRILDLWPEGSSSLSAFVDANRTIVAKLSHESNEMRLREAIEVALDAND